MKTQKLFIILLSFIMVSFMSSCTKDAVEVIVDTSLPQGTFTSAKSGSIVEQNGTASKGAVTLGTDAKGTQFVKFGSDFSTVLATGTVTVYLSTSDMFKASPSTGNPDLRLIGQVSKNGEQYFKLDPKADAKFSHIILWCGTAAIPFGHSKLN